MPNYVDEQYFIHPVYGATCSKTSGTSMEVILGPKAIESVNGGSATGAGSIPGHMTPLNAKDYTVTASGSLLGLWVAGHLLNGELGGCGKTSNNLTPLTQQANGRHATYENWIKRALEASSQIQRFNPAVPFIVGVHYKVTVSDDTFGDDAPYAKAPSHITITSTLVKANKNTRAITPVGVSGGVDDFTLIPKGQHAVLKQAIFHTEIHNQDKDLDKCGNTACDHDV